MMDWVHHMMDTFLDKFAISLVSNKKKGIHHIIDMVHNMIDGVHYMMDRVHNMMDRLYFVMDIFGEVFFHFYIYMAFLPRPSYDR